MIRGELMAAPPPFPANVNEEALRRQLGFIAIDIVRGRHISAQTVYRVHKLFVAASTVFSMLGAAGLVIPKVEEIKNVISGGWTTGLFWVAALSLLALTAFELYRAFGLDQEAQKMRAAKEACEALDTDTTQALQNPDPLPDITKVLAHANSVQKVFQTVLIAPPNEPSLVVNLVAGWVGSHRPVGGWGVAAPQQKPK
jgi:hypothetical protein